MLKYLTKKKNTYWFRRRINKNKEIVLSLKTKDYNVAILRHSYINFEINYLFANGIENMTDEEINSIIDKYKKFMLEKSVNKYSRKRDEELSIMINDKYFGGHTKEALQVAINKYENIHSSNDYDLVKAITTKILDRSNIKGDFEKLKDEDDIYAFHFALLKAEWELLFKAKMFQESLPNNKQSIQATVPIYNSIENIIPIENIQRKEKYKISELLKLYIDEESLRKEWNERNERDINYVFSHFISYNDNCFIDTLKREDFSKFRKEVLLNLPKKSTKNIYKNKTTKEIITIVKKSKEDTLNKATINKHIRRLHQVFEWAAKVDKIDKNLTKELELNDDKDKRKLKVPYEKKDLINLFHNSPWYKDELKQTLRDNPEFVFIPLLILFNGGAKPTELGQLYTNDIKKHKGFWIIDFNNKETKKLKDVKYNTRKIPLSQKILDLGFLDYVNYQKKLKSEKLFPSIKIYTSNETSFTNKFSVYNRAYITKEKNKTFYSFRHLVNQSLKNNKVQLYLINDVMGHSYGSNNKDISVYGDVQMPLDVMKETIDKCLTFDYIDLSKIKQAIKEIY